MQISTLFAKFFPSDIYKYINENLPSNLPNVSTLFALSVTICQNFPIYSTALLLFYYDNNFQQVCKVAMLPFICNIPCYKNCFTAFTNLKYALNLQGAAVALNLQEFSVSY